MLSAQWTLQKLKGPALSFLKDKTINIMRREEKSSAVTKSQGEGKVGPDYPLSKHWYNWK